MKKRALSGKTRLRRKHRRARIVKSFLFLVFIFSVILGLATLSRREEVKIQAINVSGNSLVSAEELRRIAKEASATAFIGVFKKDNFLLYPKKNVEKDIAERFKSIQKVSVSFESSKTLGINVLERKPSYLWCASRTDTSKNCFFMDDTGFIFSESPSFSGNIFFVYYGLLDSKNIIGSTFLGEERLKSLKTFSESVKTLGANPVGLFAHSVDDYELLLSPSAKILFNSKIDFLKTFGNLEAIVKEQERTGGKGNFFKNLEHIDLRFGSKAFFKMK